MRFIRRFLIGACVLAVTAPAMAESVRVKAFLPDGGVRLEDGRTIRLADIVFPDPNALPAPPALLLSLEVVDRDRYGTPIAYLGDAPELLQKELVETGVALAYGPKAYAHTAELTAMAVDGRWRIDQSEAGRYLQHYRVVRGVVQEVSIKKTMVWLNFGADWKTDFTIMIPKAVMKRMDMDLLKGLKNKQVAVRGFIHDYYGPRITLFDPGMLEVKR